jgi:hypothetical protein
MWTLRLEVTDQVGGLWANTHIIVSLRTTYLTHLSSNYFFFMAQHSPVDQCLHIIEASRSHSGTSHLVGLLWTSDQPDAGTSTWQHTQHSQRHSCPGGIRTRNPSKRAAADPHLRPRGHWDQLSNDLTLRWLMSYIYEAPILDVSRSHTTMQHSR